LAQSPFTNSSSWSKRSHPKKGGFGPTFSKFKATSNLNHARSTFFTAEETIVLAGNNSCIRGIDRTAWIAEIRMVKEIPEEPHEVKMPSFAELEPLPKG